MTVIDPGRGIPVKERQTARIHTRTTFLHRDLIGMLMETASVRNLVVLALEIVLVDVPGKSMPWMASSQTPGSQSAEFEALTMSPGSALWMTKIASLWSAHALR